MAKTIENAYIWVMENSPAYLAIITSILQTSGARCLPLNLNAPWAQLAQDYPPALILLSLEASNQGQAWPVDELLAQWRNLELGVPIVGLGANAPQLIQQAQEKQLQSFILKPLRSSTLPHYLNRILDGEALWAETDELF
jgi:CheY-like chemotaxis protein